MSFYGSVYYQLVDTFHKIILKNRGSTNKGFLTSEQDLVKEYEKQAVGRKGVIALDTGNRWINFSEVTEEPDSSSYKIWHGAPDTGAVKACHGFKLLDGQNNTTDAEGFIILNDYDKFETYETLYDDAGHVAKTQKKTYRLPKAQVNDKVEKLEKLVGTKESVSTLPDLGELEETKGHLYGYVEHNTVDINTLKSQVGEWDKVVNPIRTIAEVIGDMNVVLDTAESNGETYTGITEFKSLADIIGQMKYIYDLKFAGVAGGPENLVDTIVLLKTNADETEKTVAENKTTSDLQFNALGNRIGEGINDDSIYDHINRIYNHLGIVCGTENIGNQDIKTLTTDLILNHTLTTLANRMKTVEDNLDWSQNSSTVNEEIIDLKDCATELENTLNWSTGKKTVSEEIDDINTTLGWSYDRSVGGEVAYLHEVDAETNRIIADHFEKATAAQAALVQEDQRIASAINIESIPAGSTVMGEINKINATIGEIPENSENVINFIESANTNLQTQINDNKTDLQNQIDTINTNLGTKPEDGVDAFTAIAKNASDIQTLNNKVGISEGQTVAGLVADLSNSVNKNTQDIGDIKSTYMKTENANNTYVPLTTLGEWNTEKTIATEISDISAVIGDTSTWEDPDNTIALKINKLEGNLQTVSTSIGDTSLVEDNIIALLLEIKEDIHNMKVTINGLHSDNEAVPFPEVVEKESENGEEPIE